MLLFAAVAESGTQSGKVHIDESLLIGIAEGNRQAFEVLYEKTRKSIYAYALSILKNPADAEDVMQDTYLKIRSAAHLYRPEGKPLAWMFTITRNICLMRIRQQKHLSLYSYEEAPPEADFLQIDNLEDRIVMQTALKVLKDEECQIIILHAVTGLKHREISSLLQIPLSTVLSKYNRGLKKLKSELEGKL